MADDPTLRQMRPVEVGPMEELANRLDSKFLPALVNPLVRGLAELTDKFYKVPVMIAPGNQYYPRARARVKDFSSAALQQGIAGSEHGAASMMENLGDFGKYMNIGRYARTQAMREGPGVGTSDLPRVFDEAVEPLRADQMGRLLTAQDLMEQYADDEISFPEEVMLAGIQGVIQMPFMLAGIGASTLAFGPLGLPLYFMNEESRTREGDFTSVWHTAKGGAEGWAIGKLIKVAGAQRTAKGRAAVAGGGFAGITALEGGTGAEIVAGGLTGAALQKGTKAGRQAQKEAEAARLKAELMVRAAKRLEEKAQAAAESGAKEPQPPKEPPAPGEPPAPVYLEPGGPPGSVRGPGQLPGEIGLWQKRMREREHLEPESELGQLARQRSLPKDLPADLEMVHTMDALTKIGGARAYFEQRAHESGRTVKEMFAEAEEFVYGEFLGESAREIAVRRKTHRAFDELEMAAAEIIALKRVKEFSAADARMRAGEEGGHRGWVDAVSNMAVSAYEVEAAKAVWGRTGAVLAESKNRRLKARAVQIVTEKHIARVEANKIAEANRLDRKRTLSHPIKKEAADPVERFGGKAEIELLSDLIRGLDDPAQVLSVLRLGHENATRGLGWKVADYWVSGLLSGFSAHKANIGSNFAFSVYHHGYEQPIEVAVGLAKVPLLEGAIRARGNLRYAQGGGVAPGLTGRALKRVSDKQPPSRTLEEYYLRNHPRAHKEFMAANRELFLAERPGLDPKDRLRWAEVMQTTEAIEWASTRAFVAMQEAFKAGDEFAVGGAKGRSKYGTFDASGKPLLPFRLLTSEDAYFGYMNSAIRTFQLGKREAMDRGIPEAEHSAYIERFARDVFHNPKEGTSVKRKAEIRAYQREIMEKSDMLKFTEPPGRIGAATANFSNSHPLMKPLIPFVNTLINVQRQVALRTPLAIIGVVPKLGELVAPKLYADIYAGGQAQNAAISRLLAATGLTLFYMNEFKERRMTGAPPQNDAEIELDRSFGIMPFSKMARGHDGDAIMRSYARLAPLADVVAIAGTVVDLEERGELTEKQIADVMPLLSYAMAEVLVAKTYMSGPKGAMNALTEPDVKGARWLEMLFSSVIPAIVNQLGVAHDPIRRDKTGFLAAGMSRLPGFRKWLPPISDLTGRFQIIGDPKKGYVARAVGEYETPYRPTPVLFGMSMSGALVQSVGEALRITSKDFRTADDVQLAESLDKGYFAYKMTRKQLQWLNTKRNYYAHEFLLNTGLPELVKLARTYEPKDIPDMTIDELAAAGMPSDLVNLYHASNITRAHLLEVIKVMIGAAYKRSYDKYSGQLKQRLREDGDLQAELRRVRKRETTSSWYKLKYWDGTY